MKKLISLTAGILFFAVMPLIGWGIFDLKGFLDNTFRIIYLLMIVLLMLALQLFAPDNGPGIRQRLSALKHQKLTLILTRIGPILILLISPYFDRYEIGWTAQNELIRIFGLVISFFGFLLMNWAIIIIGRQFRVEITAQEYQQLIGIGPYKYIRHPRFLGMIAFFTGIPLIFNRLIPLIIVVFLIGVLIWRIYDLEKQMQEELNISWMNYKKSTNSLIPFIF